MSGCTQDRGRLRTYFQKTSCKIIFLFFHDPIIRKHAENIKSNYLTTDLATYLTIKQPSFIFKWTFWGIFVNCMQKETKFLIEYWKILPSFSSYNLQVSVSKSYWNNIKICEMSETFINIAQGYYAKINFLLANRNTQGIRGK